MNRWVRLHQSALHNAKIVTLSDRQYRAWTNFLLMADDKTGALPNVRHIAAHLRMSVPDAEIILSELVEVDLIDMNVLDGARSFAMHDWEAHQYLSDNSTERVRKFRNKNKEQNIETSMKRFSNGGVTPPESYTDTEEDSASSSSFEKPRGKKHDFNSDFEKKTKTEEPEKVKRVAEGLGLDVQSIVARVNARKPTNRGAYFTKLAVNDFRDKHPKAPEKAIRAALWGNDAALGQLLAMAVGVEP